MAIEGSQKGDENGRVDTKKEGGGRDLEDGFLPSPVEVKKKKTSPAIRDRKDSSV